MAQAALAGAQHGEIKELAATILRDQQKEIAQMQAWRKAWYPTAPDQPAAMPATMPGMGH